MPRGFAKSLTDAGPRLRCSTSLRRVGSPSAWKTWSGANWLSMYLSVLRRVGLSSGYLTVCWSVSSPSVLITLVSHANPRGHHDRGVVVRQRGRDEGPLSLWSRGEPL